MLCGAMLAMLAYQSAAFGQTLQDFGYQSRNVNGKLTLGTRPLLLIVANFAGETVQNADGTTVPAPLPQDAAYYSNMVFNVSQYPSVNGYFSAISNGRFSWTLAGVVSLNFPASQQDSAWPGPGGDPGHDQPYCSNIVYQAMASGQFNFKAFDANGDGHITEDELGIIILGNDFTGERDTGGPVTSPDGSYDWGRGDDTVGTSRVVDTPFITWCEEFEETLGPTDIYGANCFSYTLTPQSCEPDWQTHYWYLYYLDPWQRMAVGWCSPRMVSMATGGVVTIPAAQAGDPTAPVILYDPAHGTSEFWILEYRTQTSPYGSGYDANAGYYAEAATNGYGGLAVWHIQQDSSHNLLTLASNSVSGRYQLTDWNEGPPNLTWGASSLWGSNSVTPPLTWLNGDTNVASSTSSRTHLHVRPFSTGDGSITVEILTDGSEWVDFSWLGSENGSESNPFNTLAQAVNALPYGTTNNHIYIKPGTSSETMTISKPMTINAAGGSATVGH